MKLVTKSTDSIHLHLLKNLLETNGIPAVIKGKNTARVVSPYLMTEPGLWVYLDEQAVEAMQLLNNPDYEVMNKVDLEEFYEVSNAVRGQPANLNNALVYMGVTMGLILLGMFVLLKLIQCMAL
jgi:hypothetical protein